jgi:hypothetical protein
VEVKGKGSERVRGAWGGRWNSIQFEPPLRSLLSLSQLLEVEDEG